MGSLLVFLNKKEPSKSTQQSQTEYWRVKQPFLFFELHTSYCFKPNTYEFKEELINWDYKGFRLGFE